MLTDEAAKTKIREYYARLSGGLPGFRNRFGQRQMVGAIANTLASARTTPDAPAEGQNIIVVEGKTGVGKTVGYLIPALVMARELGKKLVISTGTVALQEQLFDRDLPAATKHFGSAVTFALAKGRNRFVCTTRLAQFGGRKRGYSLMRKTRYGIDSPRRRK